MEVIRGFTTIVVPLHIFCNAVVASDKTLLHKICSREQYESFLQDYFGVFVAYAEHEIATNTRNHKGFEYYYGKTYDGPDLDGGPRIHFTIHGHGACTSFLNPDDCSDCLKAAKSRLDHECGNSIGAQVQLRDCRMRHGMYLFNEDEWIGRIQRPERSRIR